MDSRVHFQHPMNKKISLLATLGVIALPFAVSAAISSTNFQIEAEDFSAGKVSGSTPPAGVTSVTNGYVLEAQFDYLAGNVSSTNFVLDAGGSASRFYCGDGFRDASETCDGTDLNNATCANLGFDSGTVTCSSSCAYTTSSCTAKGGGGGGGGGGGAASAAPTKPTLFSNISSKTFSYKSSLTLSGTRDTTADSVEVNGKTTGVTLPSTTTWQAVVALAYGANTFQILAKNAGGTASETLTYAVTRRLAGDANGDNVINDYDLSKMASLWGSADAFGDYNEDGKVNDYDFSMMVARWGSKV